MKEARAIVSSRKVLNAQWKPPVLKGMVQVASNSFRCGLVFNNAKDIENICPCRESRQYGSLCAHSIAVGLEWVRKQSLGATPSETKRGGKTGSVASETKAPGEAKAKKPDLEIRADDDDAIPSIKLRIVLAPNFDASLAQGPVTVFFQGETDKGVAPLNSLSRSGPYSASEDDRRAFDKLFELTKGQVPATTRWSLAEFTEFLSALSPSTAIHVGKDRQLTLDPTPWAPACVLSLLADGTIQIAKKPTDSNPIWILGAGIWALENDRFRPAAITPLTSRLSNQPTTIPREDVPRFLAQDWPTISRAEGTEADFDLKSFEFEPAEPQIRLCLDGGLAQLRARLYFSYGATEWPAGPTESGLEAWRADPSAPTRYFCRNPTAERDAILELTRAGFPPPTEDAKMELLGQDKVLPFFAETLPRLERQWTLEWDERLKRSAESKIERVEPIFDIQPSGEDWFSLDIQYRVGKKTLSADEARQLLQSGRSHTKTREGKLRIMDVGAMRELEETLRDCHPDQSDGRYKLNNASAGFLNRTIEDQGNWALNAPESWKRATLLSETDVSLDADQLGSLAQTLRAYQITGVEWLFFLRSNAFGGILADEMGLGKTLQTLAFLKAWTAAHPDQRNPSLIVCPTSLVTSWEAESKRFTPEFKLAIVNGPKRAQVIEKAVDSDLVITSYALIRRDLERYADLRFANVILDEAQHIKNRETQNAKAVKSIPCDGKFALTGTPIENSAFDLWSLFDFLMPGYLGGERDFKERYEVPITRAKDVQAQARLSRRIQPFVLRRKKTDVAKELPEKIEQIAYCDMPEAQKALYTQILEAGRDKVADTFKKQGANQGRFVLLNTLMRLRQICCDPELLKLDAAKRVPSGKLDLFGELLEELLDGGHRALVFSQFVQMLKILQSYLEERGVKYTYLDGSTKDRGRVVKDFQDDSSNTVFLISLKAGGVGLNLTGADTVIHYDPWWNPAVEDQATDRAHRIGQTNVVTSYKLIARGSVEEKILSLQNKKRELIQAALGDESRFVEGLSTDELREILDDSF